MRRVERPEELEAALAGKNAVVLFHTTWCPFCRSFRPAFEDATRGTTREVVEAVIDDDSNPLWTEHEIDIVPTVLFFDHGVVVRRLDGKPWIGLAKDQLLEALEELA